MDQLKVVDTDKNMLVPWYLMAAYAYYILDNPIIEDHEFDRLARELLEHYDTVQHRHKHLITKDDLKAGTLMLAIEDYPGMTIGATEYLLAIKQDEKSGQRARKKK